MHLPVAPPAKPDSSECSSPAGRPGYRFVRHDIRKPLAAEYRNGVFDAVIHLASPASPVDYLRMPTATATRLSEDLFTIPARGTLKRRRHGGEYLGPP
jgi:hypothetical protein